MRRWNLPLRRWPRLPGRYRKLAACLVAAVLLALAIWMGLCGGGWGFPIKTTWDLLDLLIIPVALGVGALLFNRAARRADRDNALDRQREAALTTYLDRMSDLLLRYNLRESELESEVRTVAVARTVSALRNLDGPRIAQVIGFLTASGWGGTELLIIDLKGADLQGVDLMRADLGGTYLREANLRGANLSDADLRGADLIDADLRGAKLIDADLGGAYLGGANLLRAWLARASLRGASLMGANLMGANLMFTKLQGAFLGEAKVTPEQLEDSELENATMPDGAKYEDWLADGRPDWTKRKGG